MKDKIENGKFVAFTYRVTDDADGSLLFEAKADAPDTMVYGISEVMPGLIPALKGLAAGDKFSVTLPPAAHIGERIEERVRELPLEIFTQEGEMPEAVQVGAVLPMMTQDGQTVLGQVLEITPEMVKMDFNHPFAGRTIRFDGEILEVRDATPEELSPRHGCGCGCHHDHCGEGDCSCSEADGCDDDCTCGCKEGNPCTC